MKLSLIAWGCTGAILLGSTMTTAGWGASGPGVAAGLSSRQVGYEIYQVCFGDTIENIAARYGVTADSIRSVNGLGSNSQLAPGQSLAIVMPSRPRIVVPKQPARAAAEVDPDALGDTGDGPLAVRYAIVTRDCTITSAIPPAYGRPLYQCDKGTRVVVGSRQGDYLGIVMADGSTGWAPTSALELTDEMITADELIRLLQGGASGGRPDIVQEAYKYLGMPYRYGGTPPQDADCSSFVQWVFASRGVRLPRTAAGQCEVGRPVNGADLQPGDRLYFLNTSGRVGHTAIYIGNGQFIHCSARHGCVSVDSLSDGFYRSRYYGARR